MALASLVAMTLVPSPRSALAAALWAPGPDQIKVRWMPFGAPTDGTRRTLFFLPSSWRPGAERPLLVAFHGITAAPDQWARYPRLLELAERHGFVVAMPDSSGDPGSSRLMEESGQDRLHRDHVERAIAEAELAYGAWAAGCASWGCAPATSSATTPATRFTVGR